MCVSCDPSGDGEKISQAISEKKAFKYQHLGAFAYVGANQAVAEFKSDKDATSSKFAGLSTFYLWRSVYFTKLLSNRNRALVLGDWLKVSIFGHDISRVAAGTAAAPAPLHK